MLFGGTLGATSTTHAGLTFTSSGPQTSGPSNLATTAYDLTTYDQDVGFVSGAAALNAFTFTGTGIGAGRSVSFSATTATGFSMSLNGVAPPSGTRWGGQVTRTFTVTGTEQVKLTNLYNNASGIPLWGLEFWTGTAFTDVSSSPNNPTAGQSATISLTAGDYRVRAFYDNLTTSYNGTVFSFEVVPAPGAIALLGAAGLMGRRRRD
jgi:hypothetical protein